MSEPMTSGEIEDVLSSIRKLVSEDLRPVPRPPARMPQAEPDKLILTPALRVAEGSAEALATLAAADAPEPTRRLRLDSMVSSFAAQVTPPADGWEAETGDATVTRLVRPPAPTPDRPVPGEAFPDAAAEDDTGEGRGITDAEIVDATAAGSLHFAWQARRAGLGDDDEPPTQDPEADVLHGPDDAAEAPMPEIDADALADMVRDILREELQGALGERMTRNIRKLVRAEVARIVTTKDLA